IRYGIYRPFCEEFLYFNRNLNNCVYQLPQLFPTAKSENKLICVESPGGKKDFSCLITDKIPDLHIMAASQCFPLYYYEQKKSQQGNLLDEEIRYERKYAITDWILKNIRGRFGGTRAITKETIFYFVYGILHSPDYRARFNDDLKKSLPRLPIPDKIEDFMDFALAGEKLATLHLNYEAAEPCPDVIVTGSESGNFHVDKMKFAGKRGDADKSVIIYNSDITISNIPLRAYEYVVNGRSAIEWIMESYRIKVDSASGIKNDPNAWAREHAKPRYILDLSLSIIGLSLKTLDIVEGLPKLEFEEEGGKED
ncbi:MAG: damage-inducible protein, partial [Desulfovibrio sp.]|nr:damage-inducible protein [Desulfovibrio sp.]